MIIRVPVQIDAVRIPEGVPDLWAEIDSAARNGQTVAITPEQAKKLVREKNDLADRAHAFTREAGD